MDSLARLPVAALLISLPVAAMAQTEALIGTTRAVAVAEKRLGGQVLEAELDRQAGRLIYEMDVARGGTLYAATVDARTGELLSTDKLRWESLWAGWFDQTRVNRPARPLSATLSAIEAETGGRVEEVGFDSDGGFAVYEIELTTAAGTAEIAVDPATGKRLPAALAD